jgi:hypothetical protein
MEENLYDEFGNYIGPDIGEEEDNESIEDETYDESKMEENVSSSALVTADTSSNPNLWTNS